MSTLTNPPTINSVLGGDAPVGYDKLVLAPITLDPLGILITPRYTQLDEGQVAAVRDIIANAQETLEAGLVSLSIIDGVQSK